VIYLAATPFKLLRHGLTEFSKGLSIPGSHIYLIDPWINIYLFFRADQLCRLNAPF